MVGIYYFIKKDYVKFSIAFSLAISLKLFAAILFIPLVLLANKKILQIMKCMLIGTSATIIQIALYFNNVAFRREFFSLASGVVNLLQTFNLSPFNNSPYLDIIFCIICIYAYIKKAKDDNEYNRIAIFLCLVSYGSLFSTVVWHPQWLIVLMPFFALSYIYINEKEKMYLFDIVGMFAFIYITVNFFPGNVDVTMVKMGILRRFFSYIPLVCKDFYLSKYVPIFAGVFFVYLFSPILVYYFGKDNKNDNETKECKSYFYARVFIGVGIFVIPSMLCIFMPKNIAQKMDSLAYGIQGLVIDSPDEVNYSINSKSQATQTFYGEYDYLKEIDVRFGTFQRSNQCNVLISLYDDNKKVIVKDKIDGQTLKDDEFYKFVFNPIKNSKGVKYTLKIQSDGNKSNSIAVFAPKDDEYSKGKLTIANKDVSSDLNMELYYDMK